MSNYTFLQQYGCNKCNSVLVGQNFFRLRGGIRLIYNSMPWCVRLWGLIAIPCVLLYILIIIIIIIIIINPQRACVRVISGYFVCLSVCHSVCHIFILEKAPFSGLKLTSVQSR